MRALSMGGLLGCLALLGVALGAGVVCPVAASAATPSAGFTITVDAAPTVFSAEYDSHGFGDDEVPNSYTITVTNSGSEPTVGAPVAISDALPPGLTATRVVAAEVRENLENASSVLTGPHGSLPCDLATVTCTYEKPLAPGDTLRMNVVVAVEPGLSGSVTNSASVSGGGASTQSAVVLTEVGSAAQSLAAPFGFARFNDLVTGVDGLTDTQAGDHPYETTVFYALNSAAAGEPPQVLDGIVGAPPWVAGGVEGDGASVKDFVVDLPPGAVGDPQAVPKCPEYLAAEVERSACPPSTQIGVATIYTSEVGLSGQTWTTLSSVPTPVETEPIYNVEPDKGYPAQFTFEVGGRPVTEYASLDQETNYGVRVIVKDIPSAANVVSVANTFFGTPAKDPNVNNGLYGSETEKPLAFLDDPTDCSGGPQKAQIYSDVWQHPGAWTSEGGPVLSDPDWARAEATVFPAITGCGKLRFTPGLEVLPETTQADEPTGLKVKIKFPQAAQEYPLLITPPLKDTTVTLPDGLAISPGSADGLEGCSEAQIALHSRFPGSCPLSSELGTIKVTTPLLTEPLTGRIYLADPGCDPCSNADAADGNMLHLYIEAEGSGVNIKQQGTIYANTTTGQLTTTFTNSPQAPESAVELEFKGGLRAPLSTPQTCGTYLTTSDISSWGAPETPDADPVSPFTIDWDGHGGSCPATPPFAPGFSAGTSNPNAGQFSPLTVTFNREDREQDLSQIQVKTPPGLLGVLSNVALCGEPQASLGTCGEASRIGSMTVAAGAGSHPFYTKGSLYLTGPYGGAPFGLSIVVPTVAGPFNLGNVVVRARVDVDPSTAALTVTTDPLPQIIDGIPLRLRTTNVTVDRPDFIFNPTNCAQQAITATITGSQGAVHTTNVPFAVSGCAGLHFGPKFTVTTSAKTSRTDGANLDVRLTFPAGAQSNITKVKVELPKQLPSRLTTLQKACPAATFEANPAACPAASEIGIVRATTPVLPVPLVGPVYFVSHGGEAFPNLIAVLQGYGVRIDLVGSTFISKQGITSSTFENVPDVQVSSFELYLPQGPFSALTANGNFCKSTLLMPTSFTAQDGAQFKQNTRIAVSGCPRAKTARAARASRARTARHHRGRSR